MPINSGEFLSPISSPRLCFDSELMPSISRKIPKKRHVLSPTRLQNSYTYTRFILHWNYFDNNLINIYCCPDGIGTRDM